MVQLDTDPTQSGQNANWGQGRAATSEPTVQYSPWHPPRKWEKEKVEAAKESPLLCSAILILNPEFPTLPLSKLEGRKQVSMDENHETIGW
ncbi:hypothetical protein R1flu_019321 [Riccia fluitans]|uniref:Uncharacterized protein n=1 Tax=Riccia fluitans TaxID=41844 RepID=A0ABD1ZIC2_9MARC